MARAGINWSGKNVLVTGGASFIGSHLVEALVNFGARISVVDNLSSGHIEYLQAYIDKQAVCFLKGDLARQDVAERATQGQQFVFHLAAAHGGRGYIETHEAVCASNLLLDGIVFDASIRNGVENFIYASSGCVYPVSLQSSPSNIVTLSEGMVGPPHEADGMYGWAKLMGEKVLAAYAGEHKMRTVSCRYFTAYGPRATESHAVIAMIARAFIRQDPFEIWGTGEQLRNWTYVSDIVEGTLAAAEAVESGDAVNVGTMDGIRVLDAANQVLRLAGHTAQIVKRPEMPTGPYFRIADHSKLTDLTGWRPKVRFSDGLAKTYAWYVSSKSEEQVREKLAHLLFER